ncbi:MAG: prepilin-type N-terminal cleavage/methylation domain-containing protein [Planctomycetota bacterium]
MILATRTRRSAFTLIEILVVLAIIATLAAIVLPQLFKSGESGEAAATRVRIDALANAIKLYESKWGDYPPCRLRYIKALKSEAPNETNEGPEALVLSLSTERKSGPYIEWQDDYLENNDGDKLSRAPAKSIIKKADLFEVVDFWGNPLIYIHCRDYGKTFKYKDAEGITFKVKAQKSKKLGTYYNQNSYQMWSIGPDRRNDNGKGDDIPNFSVDEDEGEEEPP